MKPSKNRYLTGLCSLLVAAAACLPVEALAQSGAAGKPIAVKLQDFGTGINTLGALLARTEGLYQKAGLDVTVNPPIFNASAVANVVMQGQANIGFAGPNAVVALVQQRRPVKIIAVIAQRFDAHLALTNATLDALAKKGITPESPIKDRAAALRGFKVASPAAGSATDQVVRYAFKQFGLDPARDVVLQPLPDLTAILGAFRQGAVEGLVGTRASGPAQVVADKSGRVFIEFEKEDKGLAVVPQHVLFATDDYIKNNPQAVRRFLAAHLEAKNILRKGITQAQRDRVKEQFLRDMAPATFNSLLEAVIPNLVGPMAANPAQHEVLLAIMNTTAETPLKLSFGQVFDTRIAESLEKK